MASDSVTGGWFLPVLAGAAGFVGTMLVSSHVQGPSINPIWSTKRKTSEPGYILSFVTYVNKKDGQIRIIATGRYGGYRDDLAYAEAYFGKKTVLKRLRLADIPVEEFIQEPNPGYIDTIYQIQHDEAAEGVGFSMLVHLMSALERSGVQTVYLNASSPLVAKKWGRLGFRKVITDDELVNERVPLMKLDL